MEFKVPFSDAEDILIEKKSRFIGQIIKVETEALAREHLERIRKENKDAVHNCFAYIIKEGNIERFSDDGEPQGTAGMPILEVLRREGITNVLCVVTRYFGGVLLGAGGLVRAYNSTAKLALDKAGIAIMLPFLNVDITVSYSLYDILTNNLESFTVFMGETNYATDVTVNLSVLKEEYDNLCEKITEISKGKSEVLVLSEEFRGKRIT